MTGDEKPAVKAVEGELFSVATTLRARLIRLTADGRLPCAGWVEGNVVEIGGDGVRIVTAEEFAVGDLVCLAFLIPDTEEEMRLYGRVVIASTGVEATDLRAAFIGIAESERGAILRYAYRQQIQAAAAEASVGHE
jgi:Tfp pilus assembly protein PilZ